MGYRVRPSSSGGDRRHGRSLAETLAAGKYQSDDEMYDEGSGPKDPKKNTRRPVEGEWDPYDMFDVYNEARGYNK